MWLTDGNVVNNVHIFAPERYLSEQLQARLRNMTGIEKVRLELEVWSDLEAVQQLISETGVDNPDTELEYTDLELPAELVLSDPPADVDLYAGLRNQIANTSPRWMIEQHWVLITFLWNNGPSLKLSGKLIRRKLRKEAQRKLRET